MRRSWIMLMAVALAIAVALPAEAGKPVKPDKPDPTLPTLFDVTFEFIDTSPGFSSATGCSDDTAITMELGPADRLGTLGVDVDVPMLDVKLPGLEWYRYYPYYADVGDVPDGFDPDGYPTVDPYEADTGLHGCHGAGIDVTIIRDGDGVKTLDTDRPIVQYPGLMMLQIGDGTVDFLWHSDYYREWENVGKNKPRYVATDMEDFSYVDNQLAWDGDWDKTVASTGVVTGVMNVTHFSPGVYEPFPGSPVPVEFTMTITPKD